MDGVVAVAGGAGLGDAAGGAVAFRAALLVGQENVLGAAAGGGVVTFRAADDGVLGVVELAADEPAVGREDAGDLRQAIRGTRLHVVAVGAAGEARARRDVAGTGTDGELLRWVVGEEDLLLQTLTAEGALAEQAHLLGDEFLRVSLRGHTGAAGEVGVLRWQTSEVGADTDGVAVRDAELRVARIKLEGVAALAVLGEGDGLEVRAGGGGLMAVGTGERLAVALDEAGEVEGVVEAEGIGVGEFLGVELELGMVVVEGLENAGVAALGSGNLEMLATGEWKGEGVKGPEAFSADPFLALLNEHGAPWAMQGGFLES